MEHRAGSRGHSRDATRVQSRDYAESFEPSSPGQPRVRYNDFSFGPGSVRRRFGSASQNNSPGPSSWRGPWDSSRRSVAIAATSVPTNDHLSQKLSMAGPAPLDTLIANQPYVDPGYAALNPAYDQPANVRPVWSLAKPLPHVLRPGMVPTMSEIRKEIGQEENDEREDSRLREDIEEGRIEPTLRPDRIVTTLDTIRRDREVSLYRAFQGQYRDSPLFSPYRGGRRPSEVPTETQETYSTRPTIEEEVGEPPYTDQEPPHLELPQLREAIAHVNQAREEKAQEEAYQDAVPLPAYLAEDDEVHNLHTYWSIVRLYLREPLAEFLAVLCLDIFGMCANLMMTVSHKAAGSSDMPNWAWGFASMMAIYIAGGVSGAQLNPAITTMLYIYRGFPLRKIPVFACAQLSAAFCATLISYGLFKPGLMALREDFVLSVQNSISPHATRPPMDTAILVNFITFPRAPWVDFTTAFFTEMIGTALLSVSVLALGDDTNAPPGAGMSAFIIGLLIVLLSMCFGAITGLALNPVRDFAPRVAMTVLGFGKNESLFADGYWFRVAWLGPFTGAILGGLIYDVAIFVGGESPVNYPTKRIKRAAKKWKRRWRARLRKTKRVVRDTKDDMVNSGYQIVDG